MTHPARLLELSQNHGVPTALIDEEALWSNATDLVRRADGKPIRLATKSVRIRSIIKTTLTLHGFAGVLTYSLAESNWLADRGVTNIVVGYPSVDRSAIAALAAADDRAAAITVMVDDASQLDLIDDVLGPDHRPIRVCLDIDASLRIAGKHLGVHRSPVHTARQASKLAELVVERPGFNLVGIMHYEAQVAGVPDRSAAVRAMKKRSTAELAKRRAKTVQRIHEIAELEFVNGGGTGSVHSTTRDDSVTEIAAGSGLFAPTLFDGYRSFTVQPASYFTLPVVRKPAADIATVFSGGFIASGPPAEDRLPLPVWPPDLSYFGEESAGEVQTPLRGKAAKQLSVGDRVLFRPAKAGEIFERFNSVDIVRTDGMVVSTDTYRGEGQNFG